MSSSFVTLINAIEAEISTEYLGGAILWADEKYNSAWSNAIDRLDKALTFAIERFDYRSADIEAQHYKRTVLGLLAEYKKEKGIKDVDSFLESLSAYRRDEYARNSNQAKAGLL